MAEIFLFLVTDLDGEGRKKVGGGNFMAIFSGFLLTNRKNWSDVKETPEN
jgi:hypothetical protein